MLTGMYAYNTMNKLRHSHMSYSPWCCNRLPPDICGSMAVSMIRPLRYTTSWWYCTSWACSVTKKSGYWSRSGMQCSCRQCVVVGRVGLQSNRKVVTKNQNQCPMQSKVQLLCLSNGMLPHLNHLPNWLHSRSQGTLKSIAAAATAWWVYR